MSRFFIMSLLGVFVGGLLFVGLVPTEALASHIPQPPFPCQITDPHPPPSTTAVGPVTVEWAALPGSTGYKLYVSDLNAYVVCTSGHEAIQSTSFTCPSLDAGYYIAQVFGYVPGRYIGMPSFFLVQ